MQISVADPNTKLFAGTESEKKSDTDTDSDPDTII
jgi:hypothetical protein